MTFLILDKSDGQKSPVAGVKQTQILYFEMFQNTYLHCLKAKHIDNHG